MPGRTLTEPRDAAPRAPRAARSLGTLMGVGAGLPGLGAGRGRRSAGQVDAPGRQSQGEVEGSSEVQDQISRWELAGI